MPIGERTVFEIRISQQLGLAVFALLYLVTNVLVNRYLPLLEMPVKYLIVFTTIFIFDAFAIFWRRKRILKTVEQELTRPGVPTQGTSLVLVEMLFFGILNDRIREKMIELIVRHDPANLVLHQKTMQRFGKRWLGYIWANWRKGSPLHRVAADLAYHEGWLPVEMQNRIKAKLSKIDTALAR